MARAWKRPGPLGSGMLTLPHADITSRASFDADYSLPGSHLLRVAAPTHIEVELRCSQRDDLGPDYERIPPSEAAEICSKLDEEEEKRGIVKPKPLVRHVYMHLAIGPQAVYHQPFKRADPRDPLNSAEAGATAAVDINIVMRDDDAPGFEFTAALQGAANFIVLDPNRNNPDVSDPNELLRANHTLQGQLQLQLAYYFKSFTVLGTKLSFSLMLQAAGSATYQYDPTTKQAGMSYGLGMAGGAGLDIELNDKTSLGPQCSAGPTGSFDGRFNSTGGTVDFACSVVLKGQFDLGPGAEPPPKKK